MSKGMIMVYVGIGGIATTIIWGIISVIISLKNKKSPFDYINEVEQENNASNTLKDDNVDDKTEPLDNEDTLLLKEEDNKDLSD